MIKYVPKMPNLKEKSFGGAWSVHDKYTSLSRDEAILKFVGDDKNYTEDRIEIIKKDFCETYKEWMFSNTKNVVGSKDFTEACFTNGTCQSFDYFSLRYGKTHRMRISKSDYFYHQMMKRLFYPENYSFIEEDKLRKGDALLISVPFSDTGNEPNNLEDLLCMCDDLKIPVLLDLAYLNLSIDIEIDLSHKCIEYVVSSLSKIFPIENHRVGIRLQRKIWEDQLYVFNDAENNYINHMSAYIGTYLMTNWSSDYIFNKYRDKQLEYCKELDLKPSKCVIFGIDTKNNFPEYNRGGDSNRLCFSRVWDGRI